jgi:hypothetical protein
MNDAVQMMLCVAALLVLPCLYLWLCIRIRRVKLSRPPYGEFFILFGNVGGWVLAIGLSPSGLAASSLFFLMFIGCPLLIISSLQLLFRKERTIYHRVAMWCGFGFLLLPVSMGVVAGLFFH